MEFFFLAAGLLAAAAAVIWYVQAFGRGGETAADAGEEETLELSREGIEALGTAADALAALMEHPELGGPGFITVCFPPPLAADGTAVAAVQYPNIREALYRRILRQELAPEELRAEGAPEALLALSPCFETESGGVVLVSVRVSGLDPALAERMAGHHGRQEALGALMEGLRQRCPRLSVRCVGGELLLSPVREGGEGLNGEAHPDPNCIK